MITPKLSSSSSSRRRSVSRWSAGAVAMLSAIVLVACSSTGTPNISKGDDGVSDVSVVVGAFPFLESSVPWLVGQEKGFFNDEGVNVKEIIGSAGGSSDIRNALASDAPLASVGTLAAAEARKSGIPLKAVAGPSRNLALTYLVSSKESGINTLDDIKSAKDLKWGYSGENSVTQSYMFLAIEKLGLDPEAVQQDSTGDIGAAVTLLSSGEIDLTFLPAIFYDGMEDNFGALVATGDEIVPDYSWELLVTTEDILNEHQDVIVALLKGYKTAVDYVNENPSEAALLWAAAADLDPETATSVVTLAVEAGVFGYGSITDLGWDSVYDSLERNDISESVAKELFDNSVIDALGFTIPEKLKK